MRAIHVDTRTGKEVALKDEWKLGEGQRFLRVAHVEDEGGKMIYILMAYHSLVHSELSWEEFVGVFDDRDKAIRAVDLERFAWIEDANGRWTTCDCSVGSGIRRSFHILTLDMNSTMAELPGDKELSGLAKDVRSPTK